MDRVDKELAGFLSHVNAVEPNEARVANRGAVGRPDEGNGGNAKCSDAALAKAAQLELGKPVAATKRVEIADQWYDLGKKLGKRIVERDVVGVLKIRERVTDRAIRDCGDRSGIRQPGGRRRWAG